MAWLPSWSAAGADGTLAYKHQGLTLYLKGVPEQVWMNLNYSPVVDESGRELA